MCGLGLLGRNVRMVQRGLTQVKFWKVLSLYICMWYKVLSIFPFPVPRIMVSQIIVPDGILMLEDWFNRSPICTLVFLGSQPDSLSLTNTYINSPINPQHSYFLPSVQSVLIIYLIVSLFFPSVNLVCLTQLFLYEVYLKADLFCTG